MLSGTKHLALRMTKDYVAIFGTRICRFDTHQNQFCGILLHCLHHLVNGFKVARLGVRVTRHNHHNLIIGAALLHLKILRGKRNGRESVPTLRFSNHINAFTKLILNNIALLGVSGYSYVLGDASLPYLTYNTLHHALHSAIRSLQKLKKLLTPCIVAQWPKPLARAA